MSVAVHETCTQRQPHVRGRSRIIDSMGMLTGRRRLLAAFVACLALAAGFAAWTLLPRTAVPRPRQYLDVSACLLTSAKGVAPGAVAASVWAAMETASEATHVMVSYLPDGAAADVPSMVNTLVQRHCGLIVTADTAAAPVIVAARANPQQQFIVVTATSIVTVQSPSPANLSTVAAASAPAQISQALHSLAAAA
jgi:hypothetical protein